MFVLFEEPMRRPPIHSFQLCAFLRPLVAYAGWCDEVRSSTPQHPHHLFVLHLRRRLKARHAPPPPAAPPSAQSGPTGLRPAAPAAPAAPPSPPPEAASPYRLCSASTAHLPQRSPPPYGHPARPQSSARAPAPSPPAPAPAPAPAPLELWRWSRQVSVRHWHRAAPPRPPTRPPLASDAVCRPLAAPGTA